MKLTTTIAIAVFAAPLAASAQIEVSRATITGTAVVRNDTLHVCAERNDRLWDRSALLDRDKRDIDREGRDIARLKAINRALITAKNIKEVESALVEET